MPAIPQFFHTERDNEVSAPPEYWLSLFRFFFFLNLEICSHSYKILFSTQPELTSGNSNKSDMLPPTGAGSSTDQVCSPPGLKEQLPGRLWRFHREQSPARLSWRDRYHDIRHSQRWDKRKETRKEIKGIKSPEDSVKPSWGKKWQKVSNFWWRWLMY